MNVRELHAALSTMPADAEVVLFVTDATGMLVAHLPVEHVRSWGDEVRLSTTPLGHPFVESTERPPYCQCGLPENNRVHT